MHNSNEMKEINERLDRIENAITILIKYVLHGDPQIDSFKEAKIYFGGNPKHRRCVDKAKNISEQAGSNQDFIDAFLQTTHTK